MKYIIPFLLFTAPNKWDLNFTKEWYPGNFKVQRVYDYEANVLCYVASNPHYVAMPSISCVKVDK